MRSRLIEVLDQGGSGRFTLISAPAGYGKTPLVSQWLDPDPAPAAAGLSLDRLVNDLDRFARNVVVALRGHLQVGILNRDQRPMRTEPTLLEDPALGLTTRGIAFSFHRCQPEFAAARADGVELPTETP